MLEAVTVTPVEHWPLKMVDDRSNAVYSKNYDYNDRYGRRGKPGEGSIHMEIDMPDDNRGNGWLSPGGDDEDKGDTSRRRHRRTYKELKRNIRCSFPNCDRVYASDSSLQTHMRLKHNNNKRTPVPAYMAGSQNKETAPNGQTSTRTPVNNSSNSSSAPQEYWPYNRPSTSQYQSKNYSQRSAHNGYPVPYSYSGPPEPTQYERTYTYPAYTPTPTSPAPYKSQDPTTYERSYTYPPSSPPSYTSQYPNQSYTMPPPPSNNNAHSDSMQHIPPHPLSATPSALPGQRRHFSVPMHGAPPMTEGPAPGYHRARANSHHIVQKEDRDYWSPPPASYPQFQYKDPSEGVRYSEPPPPPTERVTMVMPGISAHPPRSTPYRYEKEPERNVHTQSSPPYNSSHMNPPPGPHPGAPYNYQQSVEYPEEYSHPVVEYAEERVQYGPPPSGYMRERQKYCENGSGSGNDNFSDNRVYRTERVMYNEGRHGDYPLPVGR